MAARTLALDFGRVVSRTLFDTLSETGPALGLAPDTVADFTMEPVPGAGGIVPLHEGFMPRVRELCDKHGILLIAREVIIAFRRTGAWMGSPLWGV